MAEYYRTNRADTLREADALHQALAEGRKPLVEEGFANEAMLKESVDSLRGQFDPVNGGISGQQDRKSTRLNSSHSQISYAVFCLKKKRSQRRTRLLRDVAQESVLSPART